MNYSVFGVEKKDIFPISAVSVGEKELKEVIALACETRWSEITSVSASEESLEVVIKPEQLGIYDLFYDVIADEWNYKSGVEPVLAEEPVLDEEVEP